MKVERALRLLPPIEALSPLRALVFACAAPDERVRWGSAAPFLTLGKWRLSPEALQRQIPALLTRIADHLGAIYRHYADALAAEQRGDHSGVVDHLLAAAALEEGVGRFASALRWGETALTVAEALQVRRPEIETLSFLGRVALAQGMFRDSGRHYQRALVLAEAEFDPVGAIEASEGQGLVALAQGALDGASTWLGRAEGLAVGSDHAGRRGRILRALGEVARRRGDLARACEWTRKAREAFEALGDAAEMARTLDAEGLLHHANGKHTEALTAFREALAWERRSGSDPRIECGIRLHLAELYLALERTGEAEEEMRHAERLAIGHDLGRRLVQIYTRLGVLRGRQGGETGFVFFEQALALCRLLEPSPTLEAEVYHQYGLFKLALGRTEEGRGWLERAKELIAGAGGGPSLDQIEEELRVASV